MSGNITFAMIKPDAVKNNHIGSILKIKPNEVVMITGARSLYPSAKGFYRNYPGVCGLKRINNDTIIDLGCSRKEWKFRKGNSMLILK